MSTPRTRTTLRYLLAAAAVIAAAALRSGLGVLFGREPPFITFYPAVWLVAILAGAGPGVLAVILSVLLAAFLWIRPVGTAGLPAAADWIAMGMFAVTSVVLCLLAERLRPARRTEGTARQHPDAVREENERLALMLNSIDEEVYFTDTQGRYQFANAAALREFGHASVAGVEVTKVIAHMIVLREDGSPRPMEEAPPLRALAGEVIEHEEQIVRTPRTGELRYRLVSSAPVRHASGALVGAVSVVRDITERKRAQAALREADQRKSVLLATLVHQLRNRLASIRMAAHVLDSPAARQADLKRCGSIITREVAHMASLLDERPGGSLPRSVAAEESHRAGPPAASGPASDGRSRRVLVADDHADGSEALATLLQLAGHEVHVACDGTEAVELAARVRPDVALLDIGMPGLGGHEVALRIRSKPWGGRMTLIAMAGWGQDEDARKAKAAGFDHHLTKPMDPVLIESLVASVAAPSAAGTEPGGAPAG